MDYEYILTREGKLMHTQRLAYVDLDEGELVHFKYIKRKKLPNGKWRYYYDVEQLKTDIKDVTGISAKNRYVEAQNNVNAAKKKLADAQTYKNATSKYHKAVVEDHKKAGVNEKELEKARNQAKIAEDLLSKSNPTNQTSRLISSVLADKKVEKLEEKDRTLKEQSEQRLQKAISMVREAGDNEMKAARARYDAGVEYAKARYEYFESPLGKLETAINDGVKWLTSLFGKRKKT